MRITNKKDINDKLMKRFGFRRDPIHDDPKFNATGTITYWIDNNKIRVITVKDQKLTSCQIVKKIADNVSYQTCQRIKSTVTRSNDNGFVSIN